MPSELVGIVNITPDSFSDGGMFTKQTDVHNYIDTLIEDGASIIDIGAESTRPGATPITHEEEWQRLAPLLEHVECFPADISIDTRHPQTASKALAMGVAWINDVSGFSSPEMIAAVKDSDCKLVMMHSLTVPADKSVVLPENTDVINELLDFAHTRMGYMEEQGIARSRMIFDPGIGFGKAPRQSMEILERIGELKVLGVPLFIGHSRKSFLNLSAATNEEKDRATLEISRQLAAQGVDYLRVHNVKAHAEMLAGLRKSA